MCIDLGFFYARVALVGQRSALLPSRLPWANIWLSSCVAAFCPSSCPLCQPPGLVCQLQIAPQVLSWWRLCKTGGTTLERPGSFCGRVRSWRWTRMQLRQCGWAVRVRPLVCARGQGPNRTQEAKNLYGKIDFKTHQQEDQWMNAGIWKTFSSDLIHYISVWLAIFSFKWIAQRLTKDK